MECKFTEYPVAKYGEESVKLAGRVWNETIDKIKKAIFNKESKVITILGEPGMGKTTILNKAKLELKDHFLIYLDLVSAVTLSEVAWRYIGATRLYEAVRSKAFYELEKIRNK